MFPCIQTMGDGRCASSAMRDVTSTQFHQFNTLRQYHYLWSKSKKGEIEAIFDLITAVDSYLHQSETTAQQSLASMSVPVDWCVGKNGAAVLPMLYVDTDAKHTFCQESFFWINDRDSNLLNLHVNLVVPQVDFFKTWLDSHFVPAVKHSFGLSIFDPHKQIHVPGARALIYQDTIDADNPISVLWLLKHAVFQRTALHIVSQPSNFRMHKIQFPGPRSKVEYDVDSSTSFEVIMLPSLLKQVYQSFLRNSHAEYLTSITLANYSSPMTQKYAWPGLFRSRPDQGQTTTFSYNEVTDTLSYSTSSGKAGFAEKEMLFDESDTLLYKHDNLKRWIWWLQDSGVLIEEGGVQLVDNGFPFVSPMSNSLVPYTFLFFPSYRPNQKLILFEEYTELEHTMLAECFRNVLRNRPDHNGAPLDVSSLSCNK